MRILTPLAGTLALLVAAGCGRQQVATDTEPSDDALVSAVPAPPPENTEATYEDVERPWLPPADNAYTSNEVQLADIRELVAAAREQGSTALAGDDLAAMAAARERVIAAQAAVTGLAVRMRQAWDQGTYQGFLSDIRFHELLDLRHDLAHKRASQMWEAKRWSDADL